MRFGPDRCRVKIDFANGTSSSLPSGFFTSTNSVPLVSCHPCDHSEQPPVRVNYFAPHQIRLIIFAFGNFGALLDGDQDFGAPQTFGVRNRIHALELKNEMIAVHPDTLHVHENAVDDDALEALRAAGERERGQLALVSVSAEQAGDGDEVQSLFQNLQREAPVQLHPGRAQQRANGTRGSALLADDFSQVAGRDPQLQHCDLLALNFFDANLVGQIHKSFRDIFN